MKLRLKSGKRFLTAVLALVLLCSGVLQSIAVSAIAADDSYDIYNNVYEYIAEMCYSDQPVAQEILKSGALYGSQAKYPVYRPYAELLSVKNGKLVAGRCPVYGWDGRVHSIWDPITYTVSGTSGSFPAASGIEETVSTGDLGLEGVLRTEVLYQMTVNISASDLHLPATLAEEAVNQIEVLSHLVSADKPYMSYMKQMKVDNMQELYDALDPTVSLPKLNSNKAKNVALKKSFRSVIYQMTGGGVDPECSDPVVEEEVCYSNGALTFYGLLCSYEQHGLLDYYQNSADYLNEMGKLDLHLNSLLGEETRDGVLLTEADKETAIQKLISYAVFLGYLDGEVTLDFVDLRNNIARAKVKLKEPNAKIDLDDAENLPGLVEVLETKAAKEGEADPGDEEGVIQWYSTVTRYSKDKLTQKYTVARDLDFSENGGNTGDNTGDNTGGNTGDNTGDNTGGNTGDNTGDNTGGNTGDNTGGHIGGNDSALYVGTASDLKKKVTAAEKGDTIYVQSTVAMAEDISVSSAIKIKGAGKLDDAGHVLTLTDPNASISADAPLKVASGIDGYVPVKAKASNTYSLVEAKKPETGGKTAGSKTEMLNNTRYLYLDLDPVSGMTLNAFRASTAFSQLNGYTVTITIAGNSGSGLIKTADRMTVTASNGDGKTVAQISYVIIVMGDTNCNGKVNSSDAAVTKNIGLGKESGVEVRMAADVNFSGTLETPKVNSSDVAYIMAKWFDWDQNRYASNMK